MGTTPQRVLLRGGSIYSPVRPDASAMLTVGDRMVWVGDESEAAGHLADCDAVVDLDGRLVTAGFVDAHVHLSKTGFALQTVDLGGAATMAEALDRLERHARTAAGPVMFAHGWDESGWPEGRPFTGAELDRAVGHRVAYVSRVDAHSAVVSSGLLDQDPTIRDQDGWRGDGVVERDAHHAARTVMDSLRTTADREQALLVALRRAARMGITSVHEVNAPHISPYDDAQLISGLQTQHVLPHVVRYWGAVLGGEHADDTTVAGFAGDLCVDGALGSRTAALSAPYADADSGGHLYLDDTQVRDHVIWCTERGMQAGFHVIGDRGVDTVLAGLRQAADKVGVEAMVAGRHRLEHVEMVQPVGVALLAELGVVASVQPAFDAAWGDAGGLYEQRVGATRAASMNPFGSMHRAGVTLAFGSDSPVTPMDPWAGVAAAVHHHNPDERLSPHTAFAAHTQGGHRACRDDAAGSLVPGTLASYAVWDTETDAVTGLPRLTPDSPPPTCARTVVAGAVAYDAGDGS